ncbi:MAG TPA: hypothetical protein VFE37_27165 [Chloroflexota bacterium]|nr:hypothetical protein [Chloroflexota bacterium]
MGATQAVEVYEQHVRSLPAEEQLRLLALIAHGLASSRTATTERRPRGILELHGIAKASADGSDAQAFVNELREEWNHRSW